MFADTIVQNESAFPSYCEHSLVTCKRPLVGDEGLADTRGKDAQSVRDEGVQALRECDIGAVQPDGAPGDRPPELECEERVSPGDVVHTHEFRPRQVEREPTPEEPMDRVGRERIHCDSLERRERFVELERHLDRPPPHGCEKTNGLAIQAPHHEAEDVCGARIGPLHVVEADEKRPAASKHADDREEREPQQPHLGRRTVRLAYQQRGLERTPLKLRQLGQRLLRHRRDQVADGSESDLCLGVGRARRQDAEAMLAGEPVALLPERGLADPRIALEQHCLSAGGQGLQKRLEREEFRPPAEDLAGHRPSCLETMPTL
jgi:hypothetical protein